MIYFASDVHLGAGSAKESRLVEQRFVTWLDSIGHDAEALYLMGDIFDFWFEYRRVVPKGFVRVLSKLAALSERGVKVVFFTGNHDMWVRDYLTKECGVEIFTSPQVVELRGRKVLLAHGDNMNIGGDVMLRMMNGMFRSSLLRWLFSWLIHPDLALKFGQWWSGNSRKRHMRETLTESCTDILIDYARGYIQQSPDVQDYVFGHMHYARQVVEPQMRVTLLGEWEAEPTYAMTDNDGNITLKKFAL